MDLLQSIARVLDYGVTGLALLVLYMLVRSLARLIDRIEQIEETDRRQTRAIRSVRKTQKEHTQSLSSITAKLEDLPAQVRKEVEPELNRFLELAAEKYLSATRNSRLRREKSLNGLQRMGRLLFGLT